jgi:hypothetical protein
MADLFADEDVPFPLQNQLRQRWYVVRTVREFCQNPGGDKWTDEEVLRFAKERGWVTITCNVADFQALHHTCPWHMGIIVIRRDEEGGPQAQAIRLDKLIQAFGDFRGKLLDARPSAIPKKKRPFKKGRGG